jgi:pimeloyl-ACP methyl ester carboxylesterase
VYGADHESSKTERYLTMMFPFKGPQRTARSPYLQRLLILFAAAVLLIVSFPPGPASADEVWDQPTIILVHGAWAGPSSWNQVVRDLHDDGYRTVTPALGLQTLQADVATVRATLDTIPGKKILVAHSYGGAVISNAAYGRSDVLGLVYAAAFVPDLGDTLVSLGTGFAPSDVVNHFLWTGPPFAPGSLSMIDPGFFPQLFAQDLPVSQAAALNAAQQPTAFIPLFVTPSGPVAWHALPSWYAVSGADRMIDPAEEHFMAQRIHATTIEFPTASHVGGITVHAGRFTALIEQAVESTITGSGSE